jgi:hypothetical protein
VKAGDQETACVLINNGANLDVGYEDGCCPIIKSSNFGYENVVKALIANGVETIETQHCHNLTRIFTPGMKRLSRHLLRMEQIWTVARTTATLP